MIKNVKSINTNDALGYVEVTSTWSIEWEKLVPIVKDAANKVDEFFLSLADEVRESDLVGKIHTEAKKFRHNNRHYF